MLARTAGILTVFYIGGKKIYFFSSKIVLGNTSTNKTGEEEWHGQISAAIKTSFTNVCDDLVFDIFPKLS